MSVDIRQFDLPTLIAEAMDGAGSAGHAHRVSIRMHLGSGAAEKCFGDRTRLTKAVGAIFAALIKAGAQEIVVSGSCGEHALRPAGSEPSSTALRLEFAGTAGTGEAPPPVARELWLLVNRMGGQIDTQYDPHGAVLFRLSVPVERPGGAEPEHSSPDGVRILVADDDAISRQMMVALFDEFGAVCQLASNGEDLLELWRHRESDVILMDILMPGMDGLAATRMIRDEEAETSRARTPIIAVTADVTRTELCRSAGVDAVVTKPLDIAYLFATIRRLTSRPMA